MLFSCLDEAWFLPSSIQSVTPSKIRIPHLPGAVQQLFLKVLKKIVLACQSDSGNKTWELSDRFLVNLGFNLDGEETNTETYQVRQQVSWHL